MRGDHIFADSLLVAGVVLRSPRYDGTRRGVGGLCGFLCASLQRGLPSARLPPWSRSSSGNLPGLRGGGRALDSGRARRRWRGCGGRLCRGLAAAAPGQLGRHTEATHATLAASVGPPEYTSSVRFPASWPTMAATTARSNPWRALVTNQRRSEWKLTRECL